MERAVEWFVAVTAAVVGRWRRMGGNDALELRSLYSGEHDELDAKYAQAAASAP